MAVKVIRFRSDGGARWGVVDGDRVSPLVGDYPSTRDFMLAAATTVRAGGGDRGEPLPLASVALLPPVTADRQFLCQAINYHSHLRESGLDPVGSPFNIFFRKASSCLAPADTDIVCPAHVEFLDYEAEIGLVFARDVDRPLSVSPGELHHYVGALVAVDDISARDIQIPEMQFYKGKSYRTFGPVGPYLTLVDAADLARFEQLRLRLSVNGEVRQDSLAADMVHRPAATLTELSAVQDWQAGDLLATGTPGGCALQAPPAPLRWLAQVATPRARQAMLRRVARSNARRLKAGDVIEMSIRTDDGAVDLGVQRNRIVTA